MGAPIDKAGSIHSSEATNQANHPSGQSGRLQSRRVTSNNENGPSAGGGVAAPSSNLRETQSDKTVEKLLTSRVTQGSSQELIEENPREEGVGAISKKMLSTQERLPAEQKLMDLEERVDRLSRDQRIFLAKIVAYEGNLEALKMLLKKENSSSGLDFSYRYYDIVEEKAGIVGEESEAMRRLLKELIGDKELLRMITEGGFEPARKEDIIRALFEGREKEMLFVLLLRLRDSNMETSLIDYVNFLSSFGSLNQETLLNLVVYKAEEANSKIEKMIKHHSNDQEYVNQHIDECFRFLDSLQGFSLEEEYYEGMIGSKQFNRFDERLQARLIDLFGPRGPILK